MSAPIPITHTQTTLYNHFTPSHDRAIVDYINKRISENQKKGIEMYNDHTWVQLTLDDLFRAVPCLSKIYLQSVLSDLLKFGKIFKRTEHGKDYYTTVPYTPTYHNDYYNFMNDNWEDLSQ